MSKTLTIDAMPVRLKEGGGEFQVQIRDPGIIRTVAWTLEKRLVMTAGSAQFDEVLSMFIEFSPDGPLRNRRFVVMATKQVIGVPDGHTLSFIGSAISGNTGQVAHIYEVKAVS